MPFYPQIPATPEELFPDASEADLAWAAGLLEGDGTFTLRNRRLPRVALQIQDEDLCVKMEQLFGGSTITPSRREDHHKQIHMWYSSSAPAGVRVMLAVYPYMLERRRSQIENCVSAYAELVRAKELASPYRDEVRDRVYVLSAAGMTSREIASKISLSADMVRDIRKHTPGSGERYAHPPRELPLPAALDEVSQTSWAAGLLEAEGSFSVNATGHPRISCASSDYDVLSRIQDVLGGVCVAARRPPRAHFKQMYSWRLTGTASERSNTLGTLHPLMSFRRKTQIERCLEALERLEGREMSRNERDATIVSLASSGLSQRAISRQLGIARETVAKTLHHSTIGRTGH